MQTKMEHWQAKHKQALYACSPVMSHNTISCWLWTIMAIAVLLTFKLCFLERWETLLPSCIAFHQQHCQAFQLEGQALRHDAKRMHT